MKVKVTKITTTEYRDGAAYFFFCPRCNQRIELVYWNTVKCECGLTWKLKIQVEAIGED